MSNHVTLDEARHAEPITVTIPARFWSDHIDRDCQLWSVQVLSATKSTLTMRMVPGDIAELLSDARYYSTDISSFERTMFGICSSARATVKRLTTQFTAEQLEEWKAHARVLEEAHNARHSA